MGQKVIKIFECYLWNRNITYPGQHKSSSTVYTCAVFNGDN